MIKFGTGGWRAVIGDGFTKENVQILASAMAAKMKAENVADKGIVLRYDRRFLSKEAMQWAGVVFAANGIKASLINKSSPTPLVMFYVMKHDLPYGMMIKPATIRLFTTASSSLPQAEEMQMKSRQGRSRSISIR